MSTLQQCIHLPGAGVYELNGWGRSSLGGSGFDRDSVVLHWEYRRDGSETCDAGPPDSAGDHVLTNSSNWTRPAAAAINVPDDDYTHTSSITVTLLVIDNGLQLPRRVFGRFDGITLEATGSDVIFADGFE